jgi:hypothetical protein
MRTIAGNMVLVSLHGFERGGTSNQLVAHLGAVLFVSVVEVLELIVGASLVGVVVWRGIGRLARTRVRN